MAHAPLWAVRIWNEAAKPKENLNNRELNCRSKRCKTSFTRLSISSWPKNSRSGMEHRGAPRYRAARTCTDTRRWIRCRWRSRWIVMISGWRWVSRENRVPSASSLKPSCLILSASTTSLSKTLLTCVAPPTAKTASQSNQRCLWQLSQTAITTSS